MKKGILVVILFFNMLLVACVNTNVGTTMEGAQYIAKTDYGDYRFNGYQAHNILVSEKGLLQQAIGLWKAWLLSVTTTFNSSGELIYLDMSSQNNGSYFLFDSLDSIKQEEEGIKLVKNDKTVATISATGKPAEAIHYNQLYDNIKDTLVRTYYHPKDLNETWFTNYLNELKESINRSKDDVALLAHAFVLSRELPVSHISLSRFDQCQTPLPQSTGITLERLTEHTLLVSVKHFFEQFHVGSEIKTMLKQEPAIKNVIIDLTQASGGDLSAMKLAEAFSAKSLQGGYFVSGKWWHEHSAPPSQQETNRSKVADSDISIEQFNQLVADHAIISVQTKETESDFDGKVFILTSNKTGSAAEAFAAVMQYHNKAILVGQNTAGAMLTSIRQCVGDGWILQLPVADYYLPNGQRLEGQPTVPNIITEPSQQLSTVTQVLAETF
ncbi:S41 family peptidase [Pseudoalteromonas sp. MEBiC 03485]|uniref:S41 family peptidase n=1 Tax=Pseudoalteromonas sp. MEBiC 03485 TaxID=2571103 RepID=UPI001021DD12|nr:S41 family peptidase [Pseudoalteromonas sp. MEBiC 03485]RZD21807.1 hypothetical protein EVU92_06950 [Pseudoalteromonas sp. MEBiC 03485]